jgi:hypothetical protein
MATDHRRFPVFLAAALLTLLLLPASAAATDVEYCSECFEALPVRSFARLPSRVKLTFPLLVGWGLLLQGRGGIIL